MKNKVYSLQTINEALDADNQEGRLHREIMTVEEMEESEEYFEEKCGFNDSDIADNLM